MKVNIQIQRRTKTLNQSHRNGLRGSLGEPRLLDLVRRECAVDNTQNLAHQLRITGQEKAKLERKAQNPLVYGHFEKYLIHQERSTLRLPASTAAGASPGGVRGWHQGHR